MLGLSVVPAVLQFLGFLFLPESPRWLLQKGLTQKAWQVLSKIRGTAHVDEEYDAIKTSIEQEGSGGGEQTNTYIYLWNNEFTAHEELKKVILRSLVNDSPYLNVYTTDAANRGYKLEAFF